MKLKPLLILACTLVCAGAVNAQSFSGQYQIECVASSLSLDVSGGGTGNGAAIIQDSYTGAASQLWTFTPTTNGYYQIINVNSSLGVNVTSSSTSNGAGIQQWNYSQGGTANEWKPVLNSNGTYTFYNLNSGLVIDDPGSSTTSGTQFDQWSANGGNNQQFNVISQSGSVFPQVIVPTLNTNEVIVAAATPQEYGAHGDGITDDSGAFQAAINAVNNLGGGVVYAPAGNYAFYTNINIPTGVTLQGNWTDWTTGTGGCVGTTFKVYYGAGNTNASPFIYMNTSSALKDCNIWYPNQNPNGITAYPYSVSIANDQCLVQNVVLVNSYMGIESIGPAHYHMITVIGTPLFVGFAGDQSYDVEHSTDIRFNPNVWPASKLTNAPAVGGAYATWMKANGTGLWIGNALALQSLDTEISGYNVGVNFQGGGNCWYEGWVTNCNTAFAVVNGWQEAFTGFTLQGNVALSMTNTTSDPHLQFSHCTLTGSSGTAINWNGMDSGAQAQFQNCTISNTVNLNVGALNFVDCSLVGSTQCVMSASTTKVGFTGCTFSPSQKIVNNGAVGNLVLDSRQSVSNAFPVIHWTNIVNANLCRPAKTNLYNAMSYGATGNGTTDDTAAINAALTAAGNNGGGVVYLPAGSYYTSTALTVPSGVRLQGIAEALAPQYNGTMIEPHGGQGTTNGPPAVVLDANSGLVGVDIWYPAQNTNSYAFPPAIQGRGGNVYVVGVFSPNPYVFIDFDTYTCTNHFANVNYGFALYRECVVGNGSSGSLVNNQFHGIFAGYSDSQPLNSNFVLDNMDIYALGNCTETVANCFAFETHAMLYTFAEGGHGPNATLINDTQDGSSGGFDFDSAAASTINVIHTSAAIWGQADIPEAQAWVIHSTTNFQGTANFFNGQCWSCGTFLNLNGGNIGVDLFDESVNGPGASQINGGVLRMANFYNDNSPYAVPFGANSGLPGQTNEFIGCYAYNAYNFIFNNVTNHYAIWNDYALNSSAVFDLGPLIVGDIYPNGAYQFQVSSAFTFQAESANGINTSGITVQLSGTNLLGQSYVSNYTSANGLTIGGSSTARTVSAPLSANTIYSAIVTVTDAGGNSATNMVPYFDTINPAYYTFEAEDFDYNSGHYINNPQTNAYAGLSGTAGIDYNNNEIGSGNADYRPQGLETESDGDVPRPAYSGGLGDYDVGWADSGNWGNYTRLFPAGTYYVFMRSANGPTSDSDSMYQVTAGQGTSSQTTSLIGTFSTVNTGGWQTYAWVPLRNSGGGLATFTGGSVETLRVTTDNGGNNINCFMLIPTNVLGGPLIPITGGSAGHGFAPLPVDVAGVDLGGGPTLTIQGVNFTAGSATSVGGASLGTYNYGQSAAGYGFGTTANDTNMAAMLTGFTYSSTPQESTIGGNAYAQYQFTGLNAGQSYQVDVFTVADANPRYTLIQVVGGITVANNVLTGLAPQDAVYDMTPDASGHITVQWAWGTGPWVTNSSGNSGLVSGIAITTSTGSEPQLIQAPPTSPMPALSIRPTTGAQGLTLQWPDNNDTKTSGAASQPNLYYTPSLVAPAVWMLVTNAPVLSNGQWMVTLPIGTNSSGYYRLQ